MDDPKTTKQPPLGALPPPGHDFQVGDRADKRCVVAATDVLVQRTGHTILFADMQAAIDAYLAEAKKHGWNLK